MRYKERMFTTWKEGLLHLAIVIAFPIFPIIVYMLTDRSHNSYLYVLILTVVVSLLYEFMKAPISRCSIYITVETIVCCVSLFIMLLWSFFSLLLTYENTGDTTQTLTVWDWVLVSLFIFPIGTVVFEIFRCISYDIEASKYPPSDDNLVKGASAI